MPYVWRYRFDGNHTTKPTTSRPFRTPHLHGRVADSVAPQELAGLVELVVPRSMAANGYSSVSSLPPLVVTQLRPTEAHVVPCVAVDVSEVGQCGGSMADSGHCGGQPRRVSVLLIDFDRTRGTMKLGLSAHRCGGLVVGLVTAILLSLAALAPAATAAGNDYPWSGQGYCQNTGQSTGYCSSSTWIINGGEFDPWGFGYRNCTSWVAWRMRNTNGVDFYNTMSGGRWGNANTWDDNARRLGYAVNATPAVGAIAQTDAGSFGHVAWVSGVSGSSVTIEEYNYNVTGAYNSRTVPVSGFQYIHVRDLALSDPVGAYDSLSTPTAGTIRVTGWAYDPDAKTTALDIHAYVGGPAGSGAEGHDLGYANAYRPDVAAAFPGVGANQGIDKTFTTDRLGNQPVYLYAINAGGTAGNNVFLGVKNVTIANPSPVGNLDAVTSPSGGKIRIQGWSFDPNVPTVGLGVHAYVGGPAGAAGAEGHDVGVGSTARPDVANAYPGVGDHQGYDLTFTTARTGNLSVYVYAINAPGTAGSNVFLGSKAVAVEPAPLVIRNTALPTIRGKARRGKTLTASAGAWDVAGLTVGYQWYRGGSAVAGATAPTYRLKKRDAGSHLHVVVAVSKPGYETTSIASAPTKRVKRVKR